MRKVLSILLYAIIAIPITVNAQDKTVMLDYYFNNEYRKNAAGGPERYHYTWEDHANSGFSLWGNIFRKNGLKITGIETAPTLNRLRAASIYIIADPDTKKETANPHFMASQYVKVIAEWVKDGGVLVLLANDSTNAELAHFNLLSETFGIHFNDDVRNQAEDDQFEQASTLIPEGNAIFKTARKIFFKEICTLKLSKSAKAVLKVDKQVIIATAKYGKGIVFAVGDPWFYNEYTNGRLPAGYDNDKAADDLTKWLISQIPTKK
ncbi:MAG: DUF4350 domain-containing protein [Sphingobacteriaceae bacterium]